VTCGRLGPLLSERFLSHDTSGTFISAVPESRHMIMWVMSDRAIPRSFQMMASGPPRTGW
jgi:catalase